ncbi:type IIL restriction-modification enzyme MmeI [Micromonospora echinofusca]
MREHIKQRIARDKPGNADLCSYFLLRNLSVTGKGRVGIIATNTIAQGDTREVGLDQIVDMGWTVYRANKSQPWPGTASLEVSLLWVGHAAADEERVLDGRRVRAITPSLDAESRVTGNPHRLAANANRSFQGAIVLGMGFVLEPVEAQALLAKDPRNRDVLFPYLNGEDLNSRSDCSASRWVIDFFDRSEDEAKRYPEVFAIIEDRVKPERQRIKPDGSYVLRKPLPQRWWQYADKRPAMRKEIGGLDRVLVIALVSKTGLPVLVPAGQVFSHKLGVFASNDSATLALLSGAFHSAWAWKYSSTMKTDLNYSPSDVYETFPQPEPTERMTRIGAELDSYRRSVMLGRDLGLTKLYKLVHDEQVTSADIQRLRDIHVEIDEAVAEAYGFDLALGHGFHRTRQGTRFTIDPNAQVDVLDLLLDLNHQRHEQEKPQQASTRRKPRKQTRGIPRPRTEEAQPSLGPALDGGLFPLPDALF